MLFNIVVKFRVQYYIIERGGVGEGGGEGGQVVVSNILVFIA